MALTNDGRNFLIGAACGFDDPVFDESNAHIGVGDGTAAFDSGQSDLQGTNTERSGMDSGFPERDPDSEGKDNKMRFRATFDDNMANFDWEEWGLFNSSSGGTMLNRILDEQGTKAEGATWRLTVDLELNVAE